MGEINIEVVSLNPTAIIELFQLEVPPELGGDIYCFHAGVNMFKAPVKWQGTDYQPFPIEAEGFSLSGRGEIARPKLKIANLTSYIRGLVVDFDGLIGSKVTRIRTFTRFLDSANFTTTNPDAANKELSRDEFYIDRKISENKNILEFELASPWDLENVKLPRRQIFSNLCAWKYRSAECGVTGKPRATIKDDTAPFSGTLVNRGQWNAASSYSPGDYCYIVSQDIKYFFVCYGGSIPPGLDNRPPYNNNWVAEQCSKTTTGCRLRYGQDGVLPIGIFPGTSRLPLSE